MTINLFIYDHSTGEAITRELTAEEQAKKNTEEAAWIAEFELAKKKAQEERSVKVAAYTKLGLTAEEIDTLLPVDKPIILNNG